MCIGSSLKARELAEYYGATLLSVDDIIIESLFYSGTPAAVNARVLCTAPKEEVDLAAAAASPVGKPDKNAKSNFTYTTICSLYLMFLCVRFCSLEYVTNNVAGRDTILSTDQCMSTLPIMWRAGIPYSVLTSVCLKNAQVASLDFGERPFSLCLTFQVGT